MRPHLHIGIIGYCSLSNRPLLSQSITAAVAEKFPNQEIKINWIEPSQENLLDKIHEYEVIRKPNLLMSVIPITLKDQSMRSDLDFQKQSKRSRFREDRKSQKLKTKHRRRT